MSHYLFLTNKDVSKVDFTLFIHDLIHSVSKQRESNSHPFHLFVMSLPIFCPRLTHGSVRWVTHVVLGPLGAVFNEIQVPTGGVQGVIAHVYSSLYIPHITLPDLDNGVIGQLGKT